MLFSLLHHIDAQYSRFSQSEKRCLFLPPQVVSSLLLIVIYIDINKTKGFYDKYHLISEDCGCDFCANYVLACDKFPPEIK